MSDFQSLPLAGCHFFSFWGIRYDKDELPDLFLSCCRCFRRPPPPSTATHVLIFLQFIMVEDGYKYATAAKASSHFKYIASCPLGCGAMHGTVWACFGTRHKKPSPRVHSKETSQDTK